jgi:catechol 2,3-dioxygenase-like lactoylglutathione lyase family enzyme
MTKESNGLGKEGKGMDLKFEVVILPVSDVDRAKEFYEKALGFRVDVDYRGPASYRLVQLTPPGSECSIHIGTGITQVTPGTYQGMYLVTSDLEVTRAELVARGVQVSEPFHIGSQGQTPGLDPERADYRSYASFSDPDGNGWLIQEVKKRAPGR